MNLVLAAILAIVLACVPSSHFGDIEPVIGEVLADSPAQAAGLQQGDRILTVSGHAIASWYDLLTEVQIAGGRTVKMEIARENETLSVDVTPLEEKGVWRIGAASLPHMGGTAPWMTTRHPLKQLKNDASGIFRILGALVTPKEAKATGKALGGPVMIAVGIYSSVRTDFWSGLGFLRYLNVNLAILNLLPIPVLDGGLILFAFLSCVFRRRLPEKFISKLSTVFMYLLLGLMAILIYRDSMRGIQMFKNSNDDAKPDTQLESR